jgi:hypothetical protein
MNYEIESLPMNEVPYLPVEEQGEVVRHIFQPMHSPRPLADHHLDYRFGFLYALHAATINLRPHQEQRYTLADMANDPVVPSQVLCDVAQLYGRMEDRQHSHARPPVVASRTQNWVNGFLSGLFSAKMTVGEARASTMSAMATLQKLQGK